MSLIVKHGRQIHLSLLPVMFFGIVGIGILGLLNPRSISKENRMLAPIPSLELSKSFTDAMHKYSNDHFGMRHPLVQANNSLHASLLAESANEQVWIGKDNWLFLRSEELDDDLNGRITLPPTFKKQWKDYLMKRTKWFRSQGIDYAFMVVPNKHSIYSEYLPFEATTSNSAWHQLHEFLSKEDIIIIDPIYDLMREKDSETLYLKLDTHWTDSAAYIAAKTIVEVLNMPFLLTNTDISKTKENARLAVLARFMNMEDKMEKEQYSYITVINPKSAVVQVEPPLNENGVLITQQDNSDLPRLLMYRDSYADNLIPFLSEHFSFAAYIRKPKQRDIAHSDIVLYKPDIVIEEIVEHKLLSLPPPQADSWIDES